MFKQWMALSRWVNEHRIFSLGAILVTVYVASMPLNMFKEQYVPTATEIKDNPKKFGASPDESQQK